MIDVSHKVLFLLTAMCMLLLAGCGGVGQATDSPTPEPTLVPKAISTSASETAVSSTKKTSQHLPAGNN